MLSKDEIIERLDDVFRDVCGMVSEYKVKL